jgi:hypothetical protein
MTNGYLNTLKKYIKHDKSKDELEYLIGIIDLSQFLLVTHVLTVVCNFTKFEFKNQKEEHKWSSKLPEFYVHSMLDLLSAFSKYCSKYSFESNIEDEYHNSKFIDLKRKVSYHIWVYFYLILRKSSESVVNDEIELIGLNLLHYIGAPDENFEKYIQLLSSCHQDMYFNPSTIVSLKDRILDLLHSHDLSENFLFLKHSGYCQILSWGSKIRYKSLYGINSISKAELKKQSITLES